MSNSRRLIVIVKIRLFDEAIWKRLLLAYAYSLYDQRRKVEAEETPVASEGGRG